MAKKKGTPINVETGEYYESIDLDVASGVITMRMTRKKEIEYFSKKFISEFISDHGADPKMFSKGFESMIGTKYFVGIDGKLYWYDQYVDKKIKEVKDVQGDVASMIIGEAEWYEITDVGKIPVRVKNAKENDGCSD